MSTLRETQAEIAVWHRANHPYTPPDRQLRKVLEEVGELIAEEAWHCAESDGMSRIEDEAGDVLISLLAYLALCGLDAQDVLRQRWEVVRARMVKT